MQRIMLRAKIHRATVTQCDLNYEGSCGIDQELLESADIREFEKIELYNINNGERFSTYAIVGKRGSGEISLNGAAARLAQLGDLLIASASACSRPPAPTTMTLNNDLVIRWHLQRPFCHSWDLFVRGTPR